MEPSVDIVSLVSTLLDSAKYKEAVSVPNKKELLENFKDNCWDLVSVIISKIHDDTAIIKPSLQGACEELLSIIIQRTTPEEALLEFIEQIELAKNDAQFSIILLPLQQLLKKLGIKRGRSLEWCLNSISTYIEGIPMPEFQLDGKERLLMDCDPNVRRIIRVYAQLPTFYAPFIQEVTENNANIRLRQIITAFLISLLGKPLIYIDLDPESNATSEARQCCATIVQDICTLEKNVLKFFNCLELCSKESKNNKPRSGKNYYEEEIMPYEQREKINMTTLSGLYYAVFSRHFEISDLVIPQVYSKEYIFHTVILTAIHLLSFVEFGPLSKAMAICEPIITGLTNQFQHTFLQSSVHFDLCKGLVNVAIYSSFDSIRKKAVNIIGMHINKFDFKGRVMLLKYIIDTSNHSGMIGYAITLYKNSIDEAFKDVECFPDCFKGPQFVQMLRKICYLSHGAESDLVELADQIITSLNFLRYLALRDINNLTGIKNSFQFIESEYLDKLKTGLNMSKAHYEVKLRDIIEGKLMPDEECNVSLSVSGNALDNIPKEKKKEIINSALNAFHLIEGLVARLSECIITNKLQ